jgi:hypothetical protein
MVRARRLNARIPAPANYEEVVDLYDDTDAARSLLDSLYPSSHSDYQTSGPRLKAWQRAVLFYEALDPNSNNVGNDGWNPAKRALLPNIDHVMRDFGDGPDGWPTWISDPTSPDKGGQIDPTTSDAARYRAWVVVKTRRTYNSRTKFQTVDARRNKVARDMAAPGFDYNGFLQGDITGFTYVPPGDYHTEDS